MAPGELHGFTTRLEIEKYIMHTNKPCISLEYIIMSERFETKISPRFGERFSNVYFLQRSLSDQILPLHSRPIGLLSS